MFPHTLLFSAYSQYGVKVYFLCIASWTCMDQWCDVNDTVSNKDIDDHSAKCYISSCVYIFGTPIRSISLLLTAQVWTKLTRTCL